MSKNSWALFMAVFLVSSPSKSVSRKTKVLLLKPEVILGGASNFSYRKMIP